MQAGGILRRSLFAPTDPLEPSKQHCILPFEPSLPAGLRTASEAKNTANESERADTQQQIAEAREHLNAMMGK
jgi:hypothetical protein